MLKFKSEIDMFGVDLRPKYARTKYTVVEGDRRDIWKAQKLHRSYDQEAIISVIEVPKLDVAI